MLSYQLRLVYFVSKTGVHEGGQEIYDNIKTVQGVYD
jgi:hypothetical protein